MSPIDVNEPIAVQLQRGIEGPASHLEVDSGSEAFPPRVPRLSVQSALWAVEY